MLNKLQKYSKKSFVLSIIHFSIIGICILSFVFVEYIPKNLPNNGMFTGIFLFSYILFGSFIVPIIIIIFCIKGLFKKERILIHIICLILSIFYFCVYLIFMIKYIPILIYAT